MVTKPTHRSGPGGLAGWKRARRTQLNPQTEAISKFQLETRGKTTGRSYSGQGFVRQRPVSATRYETLDGLPACGGC